MSGTDAYISYTHRFFNKWLPVYDLFARSIFYAYRAAVKHVAPRPGISVLDICAGTGEITVRCARRGADVTAIDVTEAMLRKAREKAGDLPVRFVVMDARRLEFTDASFDTSVLSFALHDMPRKVRLQVLLEAVRVTRGKVTVVDYGICGGPRLRNLLIRLVSLFETAYFPGFAREGIPALLEELGLRGVEVARPGRLFFSIYEIEA